MTALSPLPCPKDSAGSRPTGPQPSVFPELQVRYATVVEPSPIPFAKVIEMPFPSMGNTVPSVGNPAPATNEGFFQAPVFTTGEPSASSSAGETTADFTDADLFAAFAPLFPPGISTGSAPGTPPDMEPLLRTTIRRALAERTPSTGHFLRPGSLDRFFWHIQALFTSRTYEDILFEKTRRFRIEEAYLFDIKTLSLLSYASCDPARHGDPRRVESTAHRLGMQLRDEREHLRSRFILQDGRGVLARAENLSVLVTLARGTVPETSLADLAYIHQNIENRFSCAIESPDASVLLPLQPYLEDCLLIQAPTAAL